MSSDLEIFKFWYSTNDEAKDMLSILDKYGMHSQLKNKNIRVKLLFCFKDRSEEVLRSLGIFSNMEIRILSNQRFFEHLDEGSYIWEDNELLLAAVFLSFEENNPELVKEFRLANEDFQFGRLTDKILVNK